jgi:hypothetical protein
MNPFSVLGVSEDATPQEISAKYREKLRVLAARRGENADPRQEALLIAAMSDIQSKYDARKAGFEYASAPDRVLEAGKAENNCRCGFPEHDLSHDRDAASKGALPKGVYHRYTPTHCTMCGKKDDVLHGPQGVCKDCADDHYESKNEGEILSFTARKKSARVHLTKPRRLDHESSCLDKKCEGSADMCATEYGDDDHTTCSMNHKCGWQKLKMRVATYGGKDAVSGRLHNESAEISGIILEQNVYVDHCLICDKKKTMKSISPFEEQCSKCHTKYYRTDSNAAPIIKEGVELDYNHLALRHQCKAGKCSPAVLSQWKAKCDHPADNGKGLCNAPAGHQYGTLANVCDNHHVKYAKKNFSSKDADTARAMGITIESLEEKAATVAKVKKQKLHPTRNPVSHTDGPNTLGVAHHEMVNNIVGKYHEAVKHAAKTGDDSTVREGHQWYERAGHIAHGIGAAMKTQHPEGAQHAGAGLLSAYSPQTEFGINADHAVSAALNNRAHGGSGEHAMGMHKVVAAKVLKGAHIDDAFHNEKTNSFAHLLSTGGKEHGDPSKHSQRVCVDRHALSIAMGHKQTQDQLQNVDIHKPTKQARVNYKHVEKAYQDASSHLSKHYGKEIAPHQVQATTWIHHQKEHGITNSPRGLGNRNAFRNRTEPKIRTKNHPLARKDGQMMRDKKSSVSLIDHPKNESIFELEARITNRIKIVEGVKFADKKLKFLGDDKTAKKQKSIVGSCA